MRGFARHAAAAVLAASLLASFGARAALFDDEEARKRIEATNQRLSQVQKQLEDRLTALEAQLKSQGLMEMFNQVELLKADVARLRGQIEVMVYELSEAQKRQKDLYVDLDTRLRKMESGAATASSPQPGAPGAAAAPGAPALAGPAPSPVASAGAAAPGGPPPPAAVPPSAVGAPAAAASAPASGRAAAGDVATEQRAYDAALDQFKGANYPAAIAGFTTFVKTYPRSPLAPSAQYWLGSAQFAQKDYRGAIASQRQLVSTYPDSQKVPDAMLNIATSQFELADNAGGRRTLEDLVARYPQSDAAAKARQRLAGR